MQTLNRGLSRRAVMTGAGGMAVASASAQPRPEAALGTPPSVISNPPRQWGRGAPPEIYPDPDIIVIDPVFKESLLGITAIRRVWSGFKWAEGPAWCSEGQYLVFSDVQASIQYRFLWDDKRVTEFRNPSWNSNGNAFDFQGRQLSTEDFNRRVVRWEHDGSMTVIADQFEGKGLNSPNDLVPHPDGSIWFTDPPYGDTLSEGHPDEAGGSTNPAGVINTRIGAPNAGVIGGRKRELPNAVYRWDPSGRLDSGDPGRPGSRSERALFLAGLQDALCHQHRPRSGRSRRRRQGRRVRVRCSGRPVGEHAAIHRHDGGRG